MVGTGREEGGEVQATERVTPLWNSNICCSGGRSAPDPMQEPWLLPAWPPSADPTGGRSLEQLSQPLWFDCQNQTKIEIRQIRSCNEDSPEVF